MSEYWKSTPKYWCKHCTCYVRDTKLERSNHEATARHQGALKRSLRNLHRNHEREERDKERAQREIARLDGVVNGSSSSGSGSFGARTAPRTTPATPSESQLKAQREQLAALGVAIPDDFRPEMAMAGEWTVTSTRIMDDGDAGDRTAARAIGVVRKREETDEHKEEEEAIRGLFKKPRRWGRDSKTMPVEADQELDALLSGTMPLKREAEDEGVKKEEDEERVKNEEDEERVKKEEDGGEGVKKEEKDSVVKEEPDTEPSGLAETIRPLDKELGSIKTEEGEPAGATVVFKKRKPKGIRSR